MQFIILRRFSLIICFTSILFSNITGDLRLCLIRVSFQTDDIEGTTGDGKFLLAEQGYDCGDYTIDRPPHNKNYFQSQLKAVNSYYNNVSYEKFGIDLANSTVYPEGENDSYLLSNYMSYYNPYNQDTINPEKRITELFNDAIKKAYDVDQVEFSNYDLIVVIHAGIGQDFSLPFLDPSPEDIPSTFIDNNMIIDNLGNNYISVGQHQIYKGIILPETQNHILFDISESMFSDAQDPCEYQYALTGTFALMIGFAVGLPPLWNIETGESGVGIFGLMDQGSNNGRGIIVAPPVLWTRIYAGWESPIVASFENIYELLPRSENQAIKIPINDMEYFLIENRDNTIRDGISLDSMRYKIYEDNNYTNYPSYVELLFDSTGINKDENGVIISVPNYDIALPASGLLIWHIDDNIINAGINNFSINSNLNHLGIDLEEADGAQDIGYQSIYIFNDPSAGYFGDIWFTKNKEYQRANPNIDGLKFNNFTYPNTKANDGSDTHIDIEIANGTSNSLNISVNNNFIYSGFPDSTSFLRMVFDINNDDKNELFGGKDSIWFATQDNIMNRNYFHNLESSDASISFKKYPDYNQIDIAEHNSNSTKITTYHYFFNSNTFQSISEIYLDSLIFLVYSHNDDTIKTFSYDEWDLHTKRVFSSKYNYGLDLGNSGISVTDFDGITKEWNNFTFNYLAGIDLDMDANLDVIALDTSGSLYGFNSDLILLAGFPLNVSLQKPILARDLFGDNNPEIIAKSIDSTSIYIFDSKGNIKYQIASNKNDDLVSVNNLFDKNVILTRYSIYMFNDQTNPNGNHWPYEHGKLGMDRFIDLEFEFSNSADNSHIRSYIYPNPIREQFGIIRVETVLAEKIEVKLYDIAGYYIKSWEKNLIQSGNQINEWVWDVSDIESGVYFANVFIKDRNDRIETNIIKIAVMK